jgi:RHS repeat-associated protein
MLLIAGPVSTRDANGNLLAENSSTYTYDALDRLTSWYDPATSVTTSYLYDAAGNLTEVRENGTPTESYTFDAANQITNAGYAYDQNGNLTSDGTYAYTYDAEDRLVQVTDALGTVASMTYDFAGRRASLTTASGTTYFHYSGDLLIAESDSTGTLTAAYAYGDGGLLSMTRNGATYFYQTNGHGDVVSLTDATGTIVNTYSYDPWGRVLSATETVENPFRYAGYYFDSSTGLYYLWHRYYDPELRRFLTKDPVSGSVIETQSLNPYLYVVDNPMKFVDPWGLEPGDYMGPYPGYDPSWELPSLPNQRDPGNPTRVFSDPSQGPDYRWQVHPGAKGEWPHYQEQKKNEEGKWKDTGRRIPERYLKDIGRNWESKAKQPHISHDNPWGTDPNKILIDSDNLPNIIVLPGPGPAIGELGQSIVEWLLSLAGV